MLPSRGFTTFLRARAPIARRPSPARLRFLSALHDVPTANTQIYISRSLSPYLNLSIEHHLLTKSPADSTILFLYTNGPSVIIGRNQNPWVECNLPLLRSSPLSPSLVRRRSGGGAVWHDEGNVNYSVICPTANFDRDKHAQMVVRALRRLGVKRAAVNARHDIVLLKPPSDSPSTADGTPHKNRTTKVSGSAYKLTRLRSLHHGTCLLNTPNLGEIGRFLKSPLRPYIKARGVDSVSSPIANVKIANKDFEDTVAKAFGEMYEDVEPVTVGEEEGSVPEIRRGVQEISSQSWIYDQTPQFLLSYPSRPNSEDLDTTSSAPNNLSFLARSSIIQQSKFGPTVTPHINQDKSLPHLKVHEIDDWTQVLEDIVGLDLAGGLEGDMGRLGRELNVLFHGAGGWEAGR